MTAALQIDVVSDVVCPWCYVGKRQLEQALANWRERHPGEPEPQVRWHPFQLNPAMPAAGIERSEYLASKFGHADGGAIYARVKAAAEQVGLKLEMESITRQPNTLRAHALLAVAGTGGLQEALAEELFKAYFVNGADLTDDAILAALAVSAGLEAATAREVLADQQLLEQVRAADLQAREAGVSGVPFFIFGGRSALSGAVGAAALLDAIEGAAQGAS